MPNGFTDADAVHAGQTNSATKITCLFAFPGWAGAPIWYVGRPTNVDVSAKGDVDGMVGWGLNGGSGVTGWGGPSDGIGVTGLGGVNWPVFGRQGGQMLQSGGTGVVGIGGPGEVGYTLDQEENPGQPALQAGWGVSGWGGAGEGAADVPKGATNVVPVPSGVGVLGVGGTASSSGDEQLSGSGVIDLAGGPLGGSPYYINEGFGVVGGGSIGVYGYSEISNGVLGLAWAPHASGVLGIASGSRGGGRGVSGYASVSNTTADEETYAIHGLVTSTPKQKGRGPWAGWFDGSVMVIGDFTVGGGGSKSVAVPFTDGSHRRLYCMESPECWFEDFGEAKLVKGKARIKLPRDFAMVIEPDSYHVFLTPYGRSNGLCVPKRTRQGFVVEEEGQGKSSLSFAFRIVGKRKGFKAERFAKVAMPKAPKPPKLPAGFKLKDPKVKEKLPTKPSIGRPPSGALSADRPIGGRR